MLYLRTKRGLRAAIIDARRMRRTYGNGLSFARNVASDGDFNFSVWRGTTYIGPMGPTA